MPSLQGSGRQPGNPEGSGFGRICSLLDWPDGPDGLDWPDGMDWPDRLDGPDELDWPDGPDESDGMGGLGAGAFMRNQLPQRRVRVRPAASGSREPLSA